MTEKKTDAQAQGATGGALLNVAASGQPDNLTDEARTAAEKVAAENAERMAAENAGVDAEVAAAGHMRAGEKLTGVNPITGDALAAEPKARTAIELLDVKDGGKSDLQRQGEAENARTLAQQEKATKTAPAKKAAK